jgi:hypothetical protein
MNDRHASPQIKAAGTLAAAKEIYIWRAAKARGAREISPQTNKLPVKLSAFFTLLTE